MLIPVIAALLTMSLPSAAAEEIARQDTAAIRKYLHDVVMKRVSDEALLELDELTLFLMAKRKARPPG